MKTIIKETEFVYTQYVDPDGQMPTHWNAHRVLKRTKEFVFVIYTIGRWSETKKLPRRELEANGEIYWSRGTLVICFYTEEKKKRIDALYQANAPECLTFFGLSRDARQDDVRRAYKRLARRYHPDFGGNNAAFQQLQTKYKAALSILGCER